LGAPAVTTVVVTGQAVGNERFNSSAMGAGTNLGSRELAALCSIQRNLQDYARTDPRLSADRQGTRRDLRRRPEQPLQLDHDRRRHHQRHLRPGVEQPADLKQPISIDAIQSVQVNLSNYDVTQKGYTGANINAVTKSGTNEFKGSVYYVYRDDSLAGDRYNRTNGTYFAPPLRGRHQGLHAGRPDHQGQAVLLRQLRGTTRARARARLRAAGQRA
jgi:hypothetical protein